MIFELKNIATICHANIKLDGLSVIAGENDSGKSSVGKSLVTLLKTELTARQKYFKKKKEQKEHLEKYYLNNRKFGFERLQELLFDNFLRTNYDLFPEAFLEESYIELIFKNQKKLKVFFDKKSNEWEFDKQSLSIKDELYYRDVTYIQSPLLWDLQSFFNSILQIKTQVEIEEDIKFHFSYPYLLWDLYGKLINKRIQKVSHFHQTQLFTIKQLIGGEFIKKSGNNFIFKRKNVEIPLINVAHGIKSFGILQMLLENGYVSKKGILIFDEPEMQLHPKWQLEYAKIVVQFVKYGSVVLVNSHSPYMIEALKRYSDIFGIENKTNFYIAEKNAIYQERASNALTLEKIFKKLSAPFDIFDEMDCKDIDG